MWCACAVPGTTEVENCFTHCSTLRQGALALECGAACLPFVGMCVLPCAFACVRVLRVPRTIAKQSLPVDVVVVDDATTGAEELAALDAVQAFIDAHDWRCVV